MRNAAIGDVTRRVQTWDPGAGGTEFVYVDLSAVDQDSKVITGPRVLQPSEAPSRARQLIEAGDVLVSTVRPNLNGVARLPPALNGATASTGFSVLRPRPELDGAYLFHWVRSPSFIADMVAKATGASYPAVSDRIVQESWMPLPPLDEQRRIAAILDQADLLRSNRQQQLGLYETLGAACFQQLFGGVIDGTTWPVLALGGLLVDSPQNGLYKSSRFYGFGTEIVRIDSFSNSDRRLPRRRDLKRLSLDASELASYALRAGDVVLNRVNSFEHVGKAILFEGSAEPVVFESNLMRLTPDESRVLPAYLTEYLHTPQARRQLEPKIKRAVNQASVNQTDVQGISVPIPPMPLQKKFAAVIAGTDAVAASASRIQAEADALYASLQDRGFKGEL